MTLLQKEPAEFSLFDRDLNEEWTQKFLNAKKLAVDTETMGLIHGRDRLCLIQICDEKDQVACIRIEIGQRYSPNIKKIMEIKSIEKIFHFARFDVAALSSNLEIHVDNIFCTKVASKIARTYSPRHGLKELILDLIGVELDKQSQSSDWGNVNNLTNTQLAYAANDVRFLIAAQERLESMLIREGRIDLARRCFNCIPTFSELDIHKFNQIFDH